jgi:hypothetical protein
MAYPATLPPDPAPGDEILASWGDDVRAALNFLANRPACRVYHNADQSINNNAATAVAFNSERFDTDNMHDTVTNNGRITFITAGVYSVTFTASFTAAADYDFCSAGIILNGTTYIAFQTVGDINVTVNPRLTVPTIYKFAANDFITIEVYQVNGAAAARNLLTAANYSPEFSAVWIGNG